jgi:hypothetical protein
VLATANVGKPNITLTLYHTQKVIQNELQTGHQQLTPAILLLRRLRIEVQSQPGQIVKETPFLN